MFIIGWYDVVKDTGDIRPVRSKGASVFRFLGKLILSLLFLLLVSILILHLPVTQRKITRELTSYLSSKFNARVEIGSLRFSILGDLTIEDLKTWDRDSNELISIGRFEAVSSIVELLKGHYIFDDLSVSDVNAHLSQRKDGLNIQFLLESFVTTSDRNPSSDAIQLEFKRIDLSNIAFEFISEVTGTSIAIDFDSLLVKEATYSTDLNLISGERVVLDGALLNILSTLTVDTIGSDETIDFGFPFSPDFGLGLGLEFRKLDISNSDFSYHQGQVTETPKFDPSHISMKHIKVAASDLWVHEDSLGLMLDSLYGMMPGFALANATTMVSFKHDRLVISGLHVVSNTNELKAEFSAGYDSSAIGAGYPDDISIAAFGTIKPEDFTYFLTPEMMGYVDQWNNVEFGLEGQYRLGHGDLKVLKVQTANSLLEVSGQINEVWDLDKLNWNHLDMHAEVGPDFRRALTPLLDEVQIPPDIKLKVESSGSPDRVTIDGLVQTGWGEAMAKGTIAPIGETYKIDLNIKGTKVDLSHWVDLPWLGPIDFTADTKGMVGDQQDLTVNGVVSAVQLMDQTVHDIAFDGRMAQDQLTADITIHDPEYRSNINADISYAGPILVRANAQFSGFNAGSLLHTDSTLTISGDVNAFLNSGDTLLAADVQGRKISVMMQSSSYAVDTMSLQASLSPLESKVIYFSDDAQGNLAANFNLSDSIDLVQAWIRNLVSRDDSHQMPGGNRKLRFEMKLVKPGILQLLGIPVDHFTSLSMEGGFDQQSRSVQLLATSGPFNGYGIDIDTLITNFSAKGNMIIGDLNAGNMRYDGFALGDLAGNLNTKGDSIFSNLRLTRDTVSVLDLSAHFLAGDHGVYIYPDRLRLFSEPYQFEHNNPVFVTDSNVTMDHLLITHRDMQLSMDGDLSAFEVNFSRVDLTRLNDLLFQDSSVVSNGYLKGSMKYVRDELLDLHANIDSLSLFDSDLLAISLSAVKEGDDVPFNFLLTNTTNKVDVEGKYDIDRESVHASVNLDVNNLGLFSFLFEDILDEMHGAIKGEATVEGPVASPDFKGFVRFKEAGFTTADPSLTFNIADDIITLDTSGLSVRDFTLYDKGNSPLIVNGYLKTSDFQTYNYDFNLKTNQFTLMSSPESSKDQLKGLLVLATDMQLKGNEKDTYVKGNITVKDTTSLTYVVSNDKVDLLQADGIVEFVDPGQLADTTGLDTSPTFYDSLVATLPDFVFNCTIRIEDKAGLRVITDVQSGDYFQTNGGALFEVGYDHIGGLTLNGKYTIKEGLYRMSFYGLVKKNFSLVKGSSITWNGIAENGDLDISAHDTVASNSIGLIGHEIGENEQSAYKRSLNYIVGININGTIEKPEVSFTLDLSKAERTNYPVLANKLDRLKTPEYQSELNKQVFGLLVLGGFIPESSTSDINENVIATTAITNSVNALLAGQLNRFAGQHIKGVNIDVGLQSYSDYSTPGGKTVTSMDFRVSKSILDDRLSFEIGGDFDINGDQSGANTGSNNYRGDMAIIYDLTGNGDKQLKLFNNETYDIIYQEVRNTGISLIFIREFNKGEKPKRKQK